MTRKDYVIIAECLRAAHNKASRLYSAAYCVGGQNAIRELAIMLANRLQHDNAGFDRVRFLQACKITEDRHAD